MFEIANNKNDTNDENSYHLKPHFLNLRYQTLDKQDPSIQTDRQTENVGKQKKWKGFNKMGKKQTAVSQAMRNLTSHEDMGHEKYDMS